MTFEAGCADALAVEGIGVEVTSGVLVTEATLVVEVTGAGAMTSSTLFVV